MAKRHMTERQLWLYRRELMRRAARALLAKRKKEAESKEADR